MPSINETFSNSEFRFLKKVKGRKSWHDFILERGKEKDKSKNVIEEFFKLLNKNKVKEAFALLKKTYSNDYLIKDIPEGIGDIK